MARIKYVSVGPWFVNFEHMIYRQAGWTSDGQLFIMNDSFFTREGTLSRNGEISFKIPETWIKVDEEKQELLKEAYSDYMDEVAEEILLRRRDE